MSCIVFFLQEKYLSFQRQLSFMVSIVLLHLVRMRARIIMSCVSAARNPCSSSSSSSDNNNDSSDDNQSDDTDDLHLQLRFQRNESTQNSYSNTIKGKSKIVIDSSSSDDSIIPDPLNKGASSSSQSRNSDSNNKSQSLQQRKHNGGKNSGSSPKEAIELWPLRHISYTWIELSSNHLSAKLIIILLDNFIVS